MKRTRICETDLKGDAENCPTRVACVNEIINTKKEVADNK